MKNRFLRKISDIADISLQCDSCFKEIRKKNEGSSTDEEKKAKADYVIKWYEKWLETHSELERDMLKEINVENLEGRFEVIMLGTLFSEYIMKEERAFRLWNNIKRWFNERNYDYLEVLSGRDVTRLNEFEKYGLSISLPSRFTKKMKTTIHKLGAYGNDLNNLFSHNKWKATIRQIQDTCQGINQKAFWITRVMKQKGAWEIPSEFCCVSDSHVKAFLKKTGFVYDASDLFYNSKVIWEYFNQGRPRESFDLSIFRFARERTIHLNNKQQRRQCKHCSTQQCSLENMMKCTENIHLG